MNEKFSTGVIGGVIAGLLKDIPDAVFYYGFKLTSLTFWDYAGTIALGHHPRSAAEQIYAVFYEVIFSIFVGIVFVYLAPYFETRRYLLRGAIYGAMVWFAIRAAVIAYRMEPLIDGNLLGATINSMNSIVYGIVLGALVHHLERKRTV
ncbi:hypothetical protein EDC14_10426 [Hydrogenispora ethanolica]|jgi:hypothetical protein|uniref:Uncharacterized protein n=1 Tax=Hydrogenispora ethanolica TaxID=1082276 RepID=A0A4R1QZ97_HYDET|nr:hypothetical protein [Hydrogenispora ethanolica]TCL58313.1 hypothetical protein EDC14_10426 [Hydrogenispora ethanolica]